MCEEHPLSILEPNRNAHVDVNVQVRGFLHMPIFTKTATACTYHKQQTCGWFPLNFCTQGAIKCSVIHSTSSLIEFFEGLHCKSKQLRRILYVSPSSQARSSPPQCQPLVILLSRLLPCISRKISSSSTTHGTGHRPLGRVYSNATPNRLNAAPRRRQAQDLKPQRLVLKTLAVPRTCRDRNLYSTSTVITYQKALQCDMRFR